MVTMEWELGEEHKYHMEITFKALGHIHSSRRSGKMHLVTMYRDAPEGEDLPDERHGTSLCKRLKNRTWVVCQLAHEGEPDWCKECLRLQPTWSLDAGGQL